MEAAISKAKAFSDEKLGSIRDALAAVTPQGFGVVTFGSYARREASPHSDLDFLIVRPDGASDETVAQVQETTRDVISQFVAVEPAIDGAFGRSVPRDYFKTNLGGREEDNNRLTRRLLLLLEGEWLVDPGLFAAIRSDLIDIYVASVRSDDQITLFLLNDVIRYWRTMTVDYRYKTTEAPKKKEWAIRNIKLVFSRKLMYAGGLFSAGMTADRMREQKAELLKELFALPVIDRMDLILGPASFAEARDHYDYFLEQLSDEAVRRALKQVEENAHDAPVFRDLKNRGNLFTRALLQCFERKFHASHPIHRAVLF